MNPVISCSVGNALLIPGIAYSTRKHSSLTIFGLSRSYVKPGSSARRFLFPSFVVSGVFPQNKRISSFHKKSRTSISATETEVSVEEPGSAVADEASGEISSDEVGTSEDSSPKSDANPATATAKRSRTVRKSEMPPVKNEELIPGATFAGKIKSIQPFGAFVDFGAFTDGLVHISMLSDSYVKDVASVVSVGQEVKVKLIEVNTETQRISLSMRENDDVGKQRKDAPNNAEKAGPGRRDGSKPRPKKDGMKRSTKFVVGQELQGTVKNMTRSGSFISLPEGEEGFLPLSEEDDDGFGNIMGKSSLEVGQEVSVRVLRINRGQATLTMKKEEDVAVSNSALEQGVVHFATNPFVLAFRKNEDISAFLDEREKIQSEVQKASTTETLEEIKESVNQEETALDTHNVQGEPQNTFTDDVSSVLTDDVPDVSSEKGEDAGTGSLVGSSTAVVADKSGQGIDGATEKETEVASGSLAPEGDLSAVNTTTQEVIESEVQKASTTETLEEIKESVNKEETALETPDVQGEPQSTFTDDVSSVLTDDVPDVSSEIGEDVGTGSSVGSSTVVADESGQGIDAATEKETEVASGSLAPEGDLSAVNTTTQEVIESEVQKASTTETLEEIKESVNKEETALETPDVQGEPQSTLTDDVSSVLTDDVPDVSSEMGEDVGTGSSVGSPTAVVADESGQGIDGATEKETEVVAPEGDLSAVNTTTQEVIQTDLTTSNIITDSPLDVPDENVVESVIDNIVAVDEKQSQTSDEKEQLAAATQTDSNAVEPKTDKTGFVSESDITLSEPAPQVTAATISPVLVKQLREETGAGMMDCKKALSESGGDISKAQEFLRKKGLASADKKATRVTAEGRIGSYIHDSRIGVLVEVNCETDFVSRGEIFKELVDDIAMQVAACPQVEYLVTEDVPEEMVNKEKEIEMQKEDLASKPEQIRSKIVEGRIRKRLEDLALLEQPYIKNDKVTVKDMIKQTIATIGENMKVKRFVRFNLGEGLEKKSQDFAAEVAAQTAAKPVTTPVEAQPAVAEAKETEQKQSTVVVSASLVKQLREETGAGMMDCKKALAETGGDLEKAQAYLRKKGLSSADKKSSRLAAEGRIGSYIHDSRIGVLIEVNCETDFVGRSEKFKELVDDLAMQVVACRQVQFVSIEDIPETIVKKEKELEMQREDLLSKPENIREKIVEGRISKRLGELALLEQPFIKDDSVLVKDLVKQSIAAIGENIKVRRFIRFTLGETDEKETTISA